MTAEFIVSSRFLVPTGSGSAPLSKSRHLRLAEGGGIGSELMGISFASPDVMRRSFAMAQNPFARANKQVFSAEAVKQEMQAQMRTLAAGADPGEGVAAAINRAHQRLRPSSPDDPVMTRGQVERLWYGTWKLVPAHIADFVRKRARQQQADTALTAPTEIAEIKEMLAELLGKRREPAPS